MEKYAIQYERKYFKDLEKIPSVYHTSIAKAISDLKEQPYPRGVEKLQGKKEPIYRIRKGKYRIVYVVKNEMLIVLIISIEHRKDIYRNLK